MYLWCARTQGLTAGEDCLFFVEYLSTTTEKRIETVNRDRVAAGRRATGRSLDWSRSDTYASIHIATAVLRAHHELSSEQRVVVRYKF